MFKENVENHVADHVERVPAINRAACQKTCCLFLLSLCTCCCCRKQKKNKRHR